MNERSKTYRVVATDPDGRRVVLMQDQPLDISEQFAEGMRRRALLDFRFSVEVDDRCPPIDPAVTAFDNTAVGDGNTRTRPT